ncbi:MAG: hypothetical protein ACK4R6_14310 [Spirosomataceae bacterium]
MKVVPLTRIIRQVGTYFSGFLLQKRYQTYGIKQPLFLSNFIRIAHFYQELQKTKANFGLPDGEFSDSIPIFRITQVAPYVSTRQNIPSMSIKSSSICV